MIGEERTKFVFIPVNPPERIPEPTNLLAWTFVASVAILSLRRRGVK